MTRLLICTALLGFAGAIGAAPIGTAFTYQGELRTNGNEANGPYDFRLRLFSEASGGSEFGMAQLRDDVGISNGIFALELDFGTALIDDVEPWLQVEVREGASTGAYTPLTPRQKITPAPNALYALGAGVSEQALTLATENVLKVSPSGAPYTSIGAALAAVSSPGPNNRWLIDVGPGIYGEGALLTVPGYVHVRGSGANVTRVRRSATGGAPSSAASVISLADLAQLSHIGVENTGISGISIAVHVADGATRATTLDAIEAIAGTNGGTGHFGIYLSDAEPTIRSSRIRASGASTVNSAVASINNVAGFPSALIVDSVLLGAEDSELLGGCADGSGTGFGIQASNSSLEVIGSYVCGGFRGVSLTVNGQTRLRRSIVAASSTAGAFLFETNGSATLVVHGSQVMYAGNKFTGTGGLLCHDNIKANYSDASDGTTSALACN